MEHRVDLLDKHLSYDELGEYHDQAASAALRNRVESHLNDCVVCHEKYHEMKEIFAQANVEPITEEDREHIRQLVYHEQHVPDNQESILATLLLEWRQWAQNHSGQIRNLVSRAQSRLGQLVSGDSTGQAALPSLGFSPCVPLKGKALGNLVCWTLESEEEYLVLRISSSEQRLAGIELVLKWGEVLKNLKLEMVSGTGQVATELVFSSEEQSRLPLDRGPEIVPVTS